MNLRKDQQGITLVVSLIMLVVLTLLVVSAIRFGNVNLRISGNAQSDMEAAAAAQLGVERMVAQIDAADKPDGLAAMPNTVISSGGVSYTVNVTKPKCTFSTNVKTTDLKDPTVNKDERKCLETLDGDPPLGPDGKPISLPTACKDQNWEMESSVNDASGSSSKVTVGQGIKLRTGAQVQCKGAL